MPPIHIRSVAAILAVALPLLLPSFAHANDSHATVRVTTGTGEVRGWEQSIIRRDPTLAKWHWDPMTYSTTGYQKLNDVYQKKPYHSCYTKPIKQPFLCYQKARQPYITLPRQQKPSKPYITMPTTTLAYKPYITLPAHAKPSQPYICQEDVHAALVHRETSARLMQQQVQAQLVERKVQAQLVQQRTDAQLIQQKTQAQLMQQKTQAQLAQQRTQAELMERRATAQIAARRQAAQPIVIAEAPPAAPPVAPVISEPAPIKVASYGGASRNPDDDFASLSGYSLRRESANASGKIVNHKAASVRVKSHNHY